MQIKVWRWQIEGIIAASHRQQKILSVEGTSACWQKSCRGESNCIGARAKGRMMGAEDRAEQQPAWSWQEQIMSDLSNFLLQLCEWEERQIHCVVSVKRLFTLLYRAFSQAVFENMYLNGTTTDCGVKQAGKTYSVVIIKGDASEPVFINYGRIEKENAH